MTHPEEQDLALYATGDAGFVQKLYLTRHVHSCSECSRIVEEYRGLTAALSEPDLDIANWDALAAEMKANVRLGLEAGACVRTDAAPTASWVNPRLAVAMASLVILAGAGLILREHKPAPTPKSSVFAARQSVKVDTEGVTITNVYLE